MSLIMRNIKIFLWAIVFSLALVYIIKNPSLFEASVLNLTEIETIKKNQRDLAYKTTENVVDIFVDDTFSSLSDLVVTLSFSPTVSLWLSGLSGQGAYEILSSSLESTTIKLSQLDSFDPHQSILIVPFSWNMYDVLVQEATTTVSGTVRDLSIWSLSPQTTH